MRSAPAVAAVAAIGLWAGTLALGVPFATAQVGPSTSNTTQPSTTILPTTEPPPSTTAPPTTQRPSTTAGPSTTRPPRTSTTKPGATSSTARATLPPPSVQGGGPPDTFAARRPPPSGRMSPVLAWLGGVGLLTGFGLLALQWFLTKPGRHGWTL